MNAREIRRLEPGDRVKWIEPGPNYEDFGTVVSSGFHAVMVRFDKGWAGMVGPQFHRFLARAER